MEVEFSNQELADLYEGKKVNGKLFKSNPTLVKQFKKTVDKLASINRIEDLFLFQGLNYEKLVGDLKGYSSVRINDQYRLIFEEVLSDSDIGPPQVSLLVIEDISNHYS